jgi:molecular chaperone DnaK
MSSDNENTLHALGIDLGTYNSAAAYAISKKNIIMVNSLEGKTTYEKNFPSFVFFPHDDSPVLSGRAAKENLTDYPDRVIWGVKRLIGISYEKAKKDRELLRFQYPIRKGPGDTIVFDLGDRVITPTDILEYIVKKIKSDAENKKINPLVGSPLTSATVSVPAYYDATRINAILESVDRAGFKNLSTISEPTAAAHQYGLDIKDESFILTFDMGAGTLDVTISGLVNIGGRIEQGEIAVSGHEVLGGIDIDEILYANIMSQYRLESYEDDPNVVARLKQEIERTKILLTYSESAPLFLPENRTVNFTRQEMNTIIQPLLERCGGPLKLVFDNAGLKPSEIDHVLFVGGPTFMPCIRDTVFSEMRRMGGDSESIRRLQLSTIESVGSVNPMECVAKGAALKARNLIISRSMIDPNGYGTILPSKGLRDYYCSVIDPNSGYPLSRSIVIYQTTPKTRYVSVSLVKKTEYIESDCISSKYFHLGDYNCFIKSTGQYPRIRIELEISSNKSLLMKFTHIQTDESVSFENLDQLKGEEIFLQEENPPEQSDRGDDSNMPLGEYESKNVWTNNHLEKTCTFAHLLFTRIGSSQSARLKKKIEEITTLLSTQESEDTRLILNRTQELLDILKNEKVISQDEFSYYLLELRKIANE